MMWRGVPVPTFEEGSDVEAYLERLECFMTMAGTTDNKKVSLLLCGLSSVQYETLRDLVAPETPKDVAFDDLKAKLKSHYGSTRNIRMERAKFRSITRGENESVMKFEARLRQGVRYCGYTGATLNDCLVEQFIQGINNKAITKKLLEKEGTMSLNEAVDIANTVLLIEVGSNGARRVQVRVAFHTVKERLKELWLELLQSDVFGVIAKVIRRVTRKNVEL